MNAAKWLQWALKSIESEQIVAESSIPIGLILIYNWQ